MNLDFFDSGGIPPVIVFITGGLIPQGVETQLNNIFNGKAKNLNRGAVVQVQPTGGSIDKETKANIQVEQFGSSKADDSMFENYDTKCERRIRRAFRLPPLFVGMSDDLNFASAFASYLVAEAQVFAPEREEFDTVFNTTVMRELSPDGMYKLRSRAISISAVVDQLKGLELAKGVSGVDGKSWVQQLNEVCGTEISYDEDMAKEAEDLRKQMLSGIASGVS